MWDGIFPTPEGKNGGKKGEGATLYPPLIAIKLSCFHLLVVLVLSYSVLIVFKNNTHWENWHNAPTFVFLELHIDFKWLLQALVKKDPVRRQVLRVKGCLAGSKADNLLEQGDMVLAINKEPITCFRDIEDACQALEKCDQNDGTLNMTIFRQVSEETLPDLRSLFYNLPYYYYF